MRKILFTVLMLAAPRAALACPVCFGQSDAPLAVATNMGIIFMLAVVVCVLACFATFFIHLMRRAKLAGSGFGPPDAGPDAGRYAESEGTASC